MADIYSIGVRGFIAYQSALNYTANNITNMNTPFYTRREISFIETFKNGGVDLDKVTRMYDQYLSQRLLVANAKINKSDTQFGYLSTLTNTFGTSDNDINKYLIDAKVALDSLNTSSGDIARRESYRDKLNEIISRIRSVDGSISDQEMQINENMRSVIGKVNSSIKNIQEINLEISQQNENDDNSTLLDQQEREIQDLSKYIDVSVFRMKDGRVNISLSNGSSIVGPTSSSQLSIESNPDDPKNLSIKLSSNIVSTDITNVINGGELGGLLSSKSSMENTKNMLGRLALGFADAINKQNKLGLDLNGNLGKNIFTDINDAAICSGRVTGSTTNTGNLDMNVSISSISQLTTSEYQVKFDTTNHYIVTRLSDNKEVSTGNIAGIPTSISVDGMSINLDGGAVSAGDTFTIKPTENFANNLKLVSNDPALLAMAWPVNAENTKGNFGSGNIEVENVIDTTNGSFSTPGSLNPPINIKFTSDTTYQIINANDNSVIEDNLSYNPSTGTSVFPTPGGYDPGYRIKITGSPAKDDTFTIKYNANFIGDNNNGKAMSNLFSKPIFENGSLTFTGVYNSMFSSVATQANAVQSELTGNQIMYSQAMQNFENVSGVNLQEELVNMSRYQESFHACFQTLQVAKEVFNLIMQLGG